MFMFQPEIWGGIECTINRVNNSFFDQLEFAGHYDRLSDFDLIASSGIKTLRVPVLWEKHQPFLKNEISWLWTEKLLDKLQKLEITPIIGLLHHGSGPAFTDLADPAFPNLFADFACMVARRFPFLKYYTPINEPLTTARFSGLYGHWYPHRKSSYDFAKMLLNQLKATVLAMKNIRTVNPGAKLVQTEDLAKTYSTPTLKYQADFENERRWLTYDFLFGKINSQHPMYKYLLYLGFTESELSFLLSDSCPPDIVGVNYYLTSERFLDDATNNYPFVQPGGNGRHEYVDVEAIRVRHESKYGLEVLLRECWQRYETEIAITEIHLNCHREQQLRWFKQAFDTCVKLKADGVKIKAVTAWSLLGAFGWNRLVTEGKGQYETGVFDLGSGKPRPTSLYSLIRSYNGYRDKKHPVSEDIGWWQMSSRFLDNDKMILNGIRSRSQPLLIIGKDEPLGIAFAKVCRERCINYRLLPAHEADISNRQRIERTIEKFKPWGIVNVSDYEHVDEAENNVEQCFKENVIIPYNLALACNKHGTRLLTFSSDLVFNGEKRRPYLEHDAVSPINIYGQSKAQAEQEILSAFHDALIIRTNAVFGSWDRRDFAGRLLQSLEMKKEIAVADDITISPTYIPDLINASLDLLIDGEKNIWHLCNTGCITWADFAKEIASRTKKDIDLLRPVSSMYFRAARPVFSVLNTTKGVLLPPIENAIDRYFESRLLACK